MSDFRNPYHLCCCRCCCLSFCAVRAPFQTPSTCSSCAGMASVSPKRAEGAAVGCCWLQFLCCEGAILQDTGWLRLHQLRVLTFAAAVCVLLVFAAVCSCCVVRWLLFRTRVSCGLCVLTFAALAWRLHTAQESADNINAHKTFDQNCFCCLCAAVHRAACCSFCVVRWPRSRMLVSCGRVS
jgi:hypothetical protein